MQNCFWTILLMCTAVLQSALAVTEYAKAGNDVTITCTDVPNLSIVNWAYSIDGIQETVFAVNDVFFPADLPFIERLSVVYQPEDAVYQLTLLNFNGDTDEGKYLCYSTNLEINKVFNIVLADGPSTASITGNVPVLADGSNSLTLVCNTDTATPGVTYEWGIGETFFLGETDSSLTLSPVQLSHNGADITCKAMNTMYDAIQVTSDSVILTVNYDPERPIITGNAAVYADGNNQLTLTCTANTVNPGVTFDWSTSGVTGLTSVTSAGTTSSLTITPVWSDDGQTVECIAMNSQFPDRQKTDTVTLIIHYDPSSDPTITGYDSNEILKEIDNTRAPLVLTCTVSGGNPEPSLTWSGACAVSSTTASSIVASPVQIDRSINQRSCTCDGTQTHTPWTKQTGVIFTVYFGPDEMLITIDLDVLVEGNTVAVTCESTEANPAKSITWYRNDVVMLVDSDYSHTTGTNSGTVTSQTWSKQLRWQDNESVIKCKTQNHMNQDISKTIQLNVEYGAKETTIRVLSDVSEGEDVTVTCSCHSNPDPTFNITGPAAVTVNSGKLVIRNISRTDAGSYRCEAGNKHSRDTRTATMVVKYPPDVTVSYAADGDTGVTLTCQAEGIPQTYNFGLWKHIAPDGQTVIHELQGDKNGNQYTLTLNNITYEDSGYYGCTVNNGVKGRSTQVDQTKLSEYIVIEGLPTILEKDDSVHSELGDAVNIAVNFYSVPEYTSVKWYGMNGHLPHTVNSTNVQTTFYGKSVIVAGYVTTLKFDSVTADDFISYRVVVNNTRGSASFVKTLRGINAPCTPENETFTAKIINKHEIGISWTGGCNGGAEQKFYIEYKKSGTEEWMLAHAITEYQDDGNYSVKISGLDPGTEYDIRIWAKNAKGQSDYLQLSSETLAEEVKSVSSSAVAGAVVGTVVSVLVIVCVILIVLWRRGKLSNFPLPCIQKQKERTRDVYENHAFDTGAAVESNNDAVYQQLGPSENPMIHYEVLSQHRQNSERHQAYETLSAAKDGTQYQQLHFNKDPSHGDNDVEYVNTKLN